jgi:hypothetical protein
MTDFNLDFMLGKELTLTGEEISKYEINELGLSKIYKNYFFDITFPSFDRKGNLSKYKLRVSKKIPDDMLNKDIISTDKEISKYQIRANGLSDIYKGNVFDTIRLPPDVGKPQKYILRIGRKIPDYMLDKDMTLSADEISIYQIKENGLSDIYKDYLFDTTSLSSDVGKPQKYILRISKIKKITDDMLNKDMILSAEEISNYWIRENGLSDIYKDYLFTVTYLGYDKQNKPLGYKLYISRKIPDNMLDKDMTLSADEISKYWIRSNGLSDIYKGYLFTTTYLGYDKQNKHLGYKLRISKLPHGGSNIYEAKYLKYKTKYLELKSQIK